MFAPLQSMFTGLPPETFATAIEKSGVTAQALGSGYLVFFIYSAAVGVAVRVALPPVPAVTVSSLRILGDTLLRPGNLVGMMGHVFVVLGHFLAYTYVRLSLERIPDVDSGTVVLLLVGSGTITATGEPSRTSPRWRRPPARTGRRTCSRRCGRTPG